MKNILATISRYFAPKAEKPSSKIIVKKTQFGDNYVKLMWDVANDTYIVYAVNDGIVFWWCHKRKGCANLVYLNEIRRIGKTLVDNRPKTQEAA